jgi:spore germination protein GerM
VRRSALHRFAAALALTLALAGCGVGAQDEPDLIAAENVPDGLLDPDLPTSTTAPATPQTSTVFVYFVRVQGDVATLEEVQREVSNAGSALERITALLEQPPSADETDDGLQTAIPAGTALRDLQVSGDRQLATVDLSSEFLDIEGQGQRAAFAQVVWTATRTPGVERVRFRIEGQNHAALVGDGTTRNGPVGPADYLTLGAPTPLDDD